MNLAFGMLAVLTAGDHFFISLCFFIIAIGPFLVTKGIKFAGFDLLLIILVSMVVLLTVKSDLLVSVIYVGALIWVSRAVDSFSTIGFDLFTKVHLAYAFVLFLETVVTNGAPVSPELWCIYGNRSPSGCEVASYIYGGVAFPRLYGFASEPASYGFFIALNLFVIANFKLERYYAYVPIFLLSLLLTFSFSAISLLIAVALASKGFRKLLVERLGLSGKVTRTGRSATNFLMVGAIMIGGVQFAGLTDAFLFRTVARFSEVFSGQDFSSLLRLSGTWSPVLDLLRGDMFGRGILGAKEYIDVKEYLVFFENVPVEITGQRSSALAYLIVATGIFAAVFFLIGTILITGFSPVFIFLLFLFVTSYPLTPVPFVLSALLLKDESRKMNMRQYRPVASHV